MRITCKHGGLDELAAFLPPVGLTLLSEGQQGECVLELSVDVSIEESLTDFESDLGLFAAEHLAHLIPVHAALIVVDELPVLLPGTSMSGKSTLAKAALDQGFVVAGDEYALIDPDSGFAHSWPRPMRMRTPRGWQRMDGAVDIRPDRVALVAVLQYQDTAVASLEVVPHTDGELVMTLLANTVCARNRPEDSLRAAVAVAEQAVGIQGSRGEAWQAMSELAAMVRELNSAS